MSREIIRKANVAPHRSGLAGIPERYLVICTPPDAQGSILRDCNYLWRVRTPHRETGADKGSICRYNMLDALLKASPLRARERGLFNQVYGRKILRSSHIPGPRRNSREPVRERQMPPVRT